VLFCLLAGTAARGPASGRIPGPQTLPDRARVRKRRRG